MIKILIADDEPPIREWMELCIERNYPGQFSVDLAGNGAAALELFRLHRHDIVITDIVMPNMDGLALLREIHSLNRLACFIILSSHDNFHYVRTALQYDVIEYILKHEMDESRLCQVVNNCLERIRQQKKLAGHLLNKDTFLRHLIHDNPQAITLEMLSQNNIHLTAQPLFAFAVCLADAAPQRLFFPEENGELLSNLHATSHTDNTYLFFGNLSVGVSEQKTAEAIRDYLQEILVLNKSCTVIAGPVVYHIGQLRDCLLEVINRLYLSFYRQNSVIAYSKSTEPIDPPMLDTKAQKLPELLRHGAQEEIPFLLDSFFQDILQRMPPDIPRLKWECIGLLDRIADRSAAFPPEARQELKNHITQTNSWKEVLSALKRACRLLENSAVQRDYGRHVTKAVAYLEEHYATITGLNEVAGQLYLSPEHLSRLFKAETGHNFISYLNDYRLKKAKELLEQTDYKVHQIAEMVGYSSLSYFSRLFKEAFGINPFRYRSMLGEGEDPKYLT